MCFFPDFNKFIKNLLEWIAVARHGLIFIQKAAQRSYKPAVPHTYPLEDARDRLRRLLPDLDRWTSLAGVAPMGTPTAGPSRASYVASTLSASLELVKEGVLDVRQLEAFADIYLRARTGEATTGEALA